MINKEKAVAIADFHTLKLEAAGAKVQALLNVLLDEARSDNDTADGPQVLRNQGKIDLILQLNRYLVQERPNAASEK